MACKGVCLMVVSALIVLPVRPLFADTAVILTDAQLDEIHAGGLNFDFDAVLGSAAAARDNIAKGAAVAQPAFPQGGLVVSPNSSVKAVIAPFKPIAPTPPKLSEVPVAPVAAQKLDVPSVLAPVQSSVADTLGASDRASLASSNSAAPQMAAAVAAPTVAAPAEPAAVAPVSSPSAPSVDVLATLGQDMKVSVSGNNGATAIPFSSNGAMNSLNVTDTAQQNLSAMVNVNAAGSIVPVQINLTVIMNSTIKELSNNNSLNINNFTTSRM